MWWNHIVAEIMLYMHDFVIVRALDKTIYQDPVNHMFHLHYMFAVGTAEAEQYVHI